ncbi:helix-turn-helix transcriptional regulator [Microbacterium sp. A93]|uniref:helix-turn-helix transcriptional regulator n=1 Tax=Microbacterium sp. A93 TaxID=3450716 RepID=UPI003F43089C
MTSTDGPAPLPRPHPLSRARLRVLRLVDGSGTEGLTVAAIAGRLGVHANSVRHHLTALESEALVQSTSEVTRRRGRPSLNYHATPAGRQAVAGPDGAVSPELTSALLVTAGSHPEFRQQVGEEWGRRIAGPAPGPVMGRTSTRNTLRSALGRVMSDHGFAAVERREDLELRTCPLLEQAREDPASVCGLHASMLQGILDAWGARGEARLEPFALLGGCRVSLQDAGPGRQEDEESPRR